MRKRKDFLRRGGRGRGEEVGGGISVRGGRVGVYCSGLLFLVGG